MSNTWIRISPEEAAVHPLYGVKNWLAVFAVGILLGLLRELGSLSGEAHKAGMTVIQLLSVDHPAISFAKLALGLNFVLVTLIYWALLTKHPKFRVIASLALLSYWPLAAIIGAMFMFDGLGQALALSLFSWVFSCAVWVTYLQRSKRVRVTFEHCINVNDSSTARPSESAEAPLNAMRAAPISVQDRKEIKDRASSTLAGTPTKAESFQFYSSTASVDESLWEVALAEFEGGNRRAGLYAKVFAESNGDESLSKAAYLRERIDQLVAERVEQDRSGTEIKESAERAAKSEFEGLKAKFITGKQLQPEEIQTLVQHLHLDSTLPVLCERRRGETLLHWCARLGLKHELEILLENGANPNASNANGQRPSAVTDDFEIRRILFLKSGSGEA
jgi:hypothetical protein